MSSSSRLNGKTALITGGAEGIGTAIAKLFVSEGARVIIADVQEAVGRAAAKEIGATFVPLDVSSEDSWTKAVDQIVREGRLDILVNNAGVMGKGVQDPENVSLEDWKRIHAINLDGTFLGCKYAIKAMKEKGGSIVNIASRSGLVGVPGAVAYASSKAAIHNHTKSVALYCAGQGYKIRCNSVAPASIMTPMWKKLLGQGAEYKDHLAKQCEGIPLGRFGTPEEVAYAVLYLASDESSYTTGSEIIVDGGVLAGTTTSPDTGK